MKKILTQEEIDKKEILKSRISQARTIAELEKIANACHYNAFWATRVWESRQKKRIANLKNMKK